MPDRCEYVDPLHNFPCGKNSTLAKIVINIPGVKIPIAYFICKIHGDARFNYLSMQEIKMTKQKDQNKVSYKEFADAMKEIRWKKCRRCLGIFIKEDVKCCLEYMAISDNTVTMRRSFLLHDDCLKSEMALFEVQKEETTKNTTLDSVL